MVNEGYLEEWKESRHTIGRFDNHIYDLRKYGFSFVIGLLTAGGFVISYFQNQDQITQFPEAMIIATLSLILTLQFYENLYIVWQQAAIWRSELLEKRLNLELTSIISDHAEQKWTAYYGFFMYNGILVALFCIAFFTISSGMSLILTLIVITIGVQIGFILFIRKHVRNNEMIDWTIDKLEVKQNDEITISNMSKKTEQFFPTNTIMYEIKTQMGITKHQEIITQDITIQATHSHTWFWTIPPMPEEVYWIYVIFHKDGKLTPLKRKIIVSK